MRERRREREIAARLALEWSLDLGEELSGATCSLVRSCRLADGSEGVLKVPEAHAEERLALPALQAFAKVGGIAVLRGDAETGSVLMPRLRPGRHLAASRLGENRSLAVCARMIRRLREAEPTPGIALADWFRELDPSRSESAAAAKRVAARLLETTERAVLLHGDLHHFNLLRHGSEWVAVDPKGLVGDPSYEIVAFMRNQVPSDPAPEFMPNRIRQFAGLLGDSPARLWGWSFAQTMLDMQWSGSVIYPDGLNRVARSLAACRAEFWTE